jgi:DNA-directed RNA polymerase subunit RPC12/RpoP
MADANYPGKGQINYHCPVCGKPVEHGEFHRSGFECRGFDGATFNYPVLLDPPERQGKYNCFDCGKTIFIGDFHKDCPGPRKMEPHVERMVSEAADLLKRTKDLQEFMERDSIFPMLHAETQMLMRAQHGAMTAYLYILGRRIEREKPEG